MTDKLLVPAVKFSDPSAGSSVSVGSASACAIPHSASMHTSPTNTPRAIFIDTVSLRLASFVVVRSRTVAGHDRTSSEFSS
jgi:hypothetical protein